MEYNGNEMLQGTGHPAEIQEFYSRFSAGCLNLFLVAKSVRLVMDDPSIEIRHFSLFLPLRNKVVDLPFFFFFLFGISNL